MTARFTEAVLHTKSEHYRYLRGGAHAGERSDFAPGVGNRSESARRTGSIGQEGTKPPCFQSRPGEHLVGVQTDQTAQTVATKRKSHTEQLAASQAELNNVARHGQDERGPPGGGCQMTDQLSQRDGLARRGDDRSRPVVNVAGQDRADNSVTATRASAPINPPPDPPHTSPGRMIAAPMAAVLCSIPSLARP